MLRAVVLVVVALIIGAAVAIGALFALGINAYDVTKEETTTASSAKPPEKTNEPPAKKGPDSATVRTPVHRGLVISALMVRLGPAARLSMERWGRSPWITRCRWNKLLPRWST